MVLKKNGVASLAELFSYVIAELLASGKRIFSDGDLSAKLGYAGDKIKLGEASFKALRDERGGVSVKNRLKIGA